VKRKKSKKKIVDGAEKLWKVYWKKRSIENRNKLVEFYLPVAKKISCLMKGSVPAKIPREELIQVCSMALIGCVERYDGSTNFETYSHQRLRGAVLDWCREQDHIPRGERAKRARGENVRIPTIVSYDSSPAIMDRFEQSEDKSLDVLMETVINDLKEILTNSMDKMITKRSRVLQMRLQGMNLEDIASRMGKSEGWVSQLVRDGMTELFKMFGLEIDNKEILRIIGNKMMSQARKNQHKVFSSHDIQTRESVVTIRNIITRDNVKTG